MGNPSGYFKNFEDKSFVYSWKDLVKQVAQRYIGEAKKNILNCFSGQFFKNRCGRAGLILTFIQQKNLGHRINLLVTDGNTKLCC